MFGNFKNNSFKKLCIKLRLINYIYIYLIFKLYEKYIWDDYY